MNLGHENAAPFSAMFIGASCYRRIQRRRWAQGDIEVEEAVVMKSVLSPRSDRLEAGLVRPDCPQCGDRLFASSVSVHVSDNDIRHWWNCDSCGHEFMTIVRLRKHSYRRTVC
jgi:hypothetical protein